MTDLTIKVGPELFCFTSKEQWVAKARSWFRLSGYDTHNTICVDAAGRIVMSGREFQRAEEEGTYPVMVYSIGEDKT